MIEREFERSDFEWYQDWYGDDWINSELGPIDQGWLDHILNDQTGSQFVFEDRGQPVAVAGVVWSNQKHGYYVISDLAVSPALRRQGYGLEVIQRLVEIGDYRGERLCMSYVCEDNLGGLKFFRKLGWPESPDDSGMIKFTKILRPP